MIQLHFPSAAAPPPLANPPLLLLFPLYCPLPNRSLHDAGAICPLASRPAARPVPAAASATAAIEPHHHHDRASKKGGPGLTPGGYDDNTNDPARSRLRLLPRPRTAVITEPNDDLTQLSLFLAMLESQLHDLTFFSAYEPELRLRDEVTGSLVFENVFLA